MANGIDTRRPRLIQPVGYVPNNCWILLYPPYYELGHPRFEETSELLQAEEDISRVATANGWNGVTSLYEFMDDLVGRPVNDQ